MFALSSHHRLHPQEAYPALTTNTHTHHSISIIDAKKRKAASDKAKPERLCCIQLYLRRAVGLTWPRIILAAIRLLKRLEWYWSRLEDASCWLMSVLSPLRHNLDKEASYIIQLWQPVFADEALEQ